MNENAAAPPPGGDAPRFVTFDGILEGRIGDEAALTRALASLDALGVCRFRFERDGGRFSFLPDNDRLPGASCDHAFQERLLGILRDIAASARGPVESTLRCTMVFERECAETLFRAAPPPPEGPGLEAVTRFRPLRPEDRPPSSPPRAPLRQWLGRREVAVVLPLLLLASGLVAWQSGIVDRLLSASALALRTDTAAFGDLLTIEVADALGDYEVTLRRGPGHPATREAWDARTARAATEANRLCNVVVRDGQEIWVQLCDGSGAVIAQDRVSLRPLAAGADGEAIVGLPGRIAASRVVLRLTPHEPR